MNIKQIKISGFKSIVDMELNELTPYSVFAGANGSGKSNFFDALKFVSMVIRFGAIEALRQFNGYEQIHCFKSRGKKARIFSASFDLEIDNNLIVYCLEIHDMDQEPKLDETLIVNDELLMAREIGEALFVRIDPKAEFSDAIIPSFPAEISGLMMLPNQAIHQFLSNINVYRFDPLGAKQPDSSSTDSSELNQLGHNIATILATLEKDPDIREQILECMELLVPSLEKVSTERQKLNGQTVIRFKEEGIKAHFPANLISDGTIYALCIMAAVFSRSKKIGMTLIEEPERGIHPKAIAELCALMRDNASLQHPVFVTTHSESVVRASRADELWLVNKIDGRTVFKNAAKNSVISDDLNLDQAWLMNMFDGGLPW